MGNQIQVERKKKEEEGVMKSKILYSQVIVMILSKVTHFISACNPFFLGYLELKKFLLGDGKHDR